MRGEGLGDGEVEGLRRARSLLATDQPLPERMAALCSELMRTLSCDRSSVLVRIGSGFHPQFNAGNPPEISAIFHTLSVPDSDAVIEQMRRSQKAVVINEAKADERVRQIAEIGGIDSLVLAPMFDVDGVLIGLITAEYCGRAAQFDDSARDLMQAVARLAASAFSDDRTGSDSRSLEARVLEAVINERERIGQEIHDDALQRVFTLYLRLQTVRDRMADSAIRPDLDELIDDSRALADSLRKVTSERHD